MTYSQRIGGIQVRNDENRYAGGIYARKCQIIRKGLKNNPKRHLENNTNRIEK